MMRGVTSKGISLSDFRIFHQLCLGTRRAAGAGMEPLGTGGGQRRRQRHSSTLVDLVDHGDGEEGKIKAVNTAGTGDGGQVGGQCPSIAQDWRVTTERRWGMRGDVVAWSRMILPTS